MKAIFVTAPTLGEIDNNQYWEKELLQLQSKESLTLADKARITWLKNKILSFYREYANSPFELAQKAIALRQDEIDTSIAIKLQVEGLHRWIDCPLEEVSYLQYLHRHTFHISCNFKVSHGDREIEFIKQKHIINALLRQTFLDSQYDCLNFDQMSCEHIAVWLLEKLQCEAVSVGEDGEFFAMIQKK